MVWPDSLSGWLLDRAGLQQLFCCLTANTARALLCMADAEFRIHSTRNKPHGKSRIRTQVCRSQGGRLTTVCLSVGCLTSQQHASVSQGRIYSDNCTCCHTETEVADQTFYLTQSQYTDTRPTSPSADPITPGAWQGSYWSANF